MKAKARPVVRAVFEFYPKRWPDVDGKEADAEQIQECCQNLYGYEKDYKRPRVVSVSLVRSSRTVAPRHEGKGGR